MIRRALIKPVRPILRLSRRIWRWVRQPMIVHLYTTAWNEADLVGFFLRHYEPWVDRFVVYDDGSTDETVELLRAHPRVEVRRFERCIADSFVESQREQYNHVWKESRGRADWVIVTALDEHLHIPGQDMRRYLRNCRSENVTYVPALGYQMIAANLPTGKELLCRTCTWGAPFEDMTKLSLFNPNAVEETNFGNGRHSACPTGVVQLPKRDDLLLLHYKYLGFERTCARLRFQKSGLGVKDIKNGWGHQYLWSPEQLRVDWDDFQRRAVDVSRPNLQPWKNHPSKRWWRAAA